MSEDDLRAAVPRLDDQQERALAEAEGWIGGDVQGVAIGATPQGADCVVVYVRDTGAPLASRLPEHFAGLPVRVESSDDFHAQG